MLVDGFRLAREHGLEAELVVAGEGRVAVGGAGVRRVGRVEDLGALYAGALAVVLPSWLEGFGLPPVEGIAAGAPAIVSDLPVLREVLGDDPQRASFVPVGDATALAEALVRRLTEPDRRGAAEDRRAWAARYTWAATASATLAAYQRAAAA